MKNCSICNKELKGLQRRFCSNQCKHKAHNNKFNNYKAQQKRGDIRRRKLIESKGGQCQSCGYKRNIAALCFHHVDSSTKSFQVSLRECSNHSWEKLTEEVLKCNLLCHNCHMELHHPESLVEKEGLEPPHLLVMS